MRDNKKNYFSDLRKYFSFSFNVHTCTWTNPLTLSIFLCVFSMLFLFSSDTILTACLLPYTVMKDTNQIEFNLLKVYFLFFIMIKTSDKFFHPKYVYMSIEFGSIFATCIDVNLIVRLFYYYFILEFHVLYKS